MDTVSCSVAALFFLSLGYLCRKAVERFFFLQVPCDMYMHIWCKHTCCFVCRNLSFGNHIYIHMHTYLQRLLLLDAYKLVFWEPYIYIYIYIYIDRHICTYIHIYICIYMYIYTYILCLHGGQDACIQRVAVRPPRLCFARAPHVLLHLKL
jgi:hypothetical protein